MAVANGTASKRTDSKPKAVKSSVSDVVVGRGAVVTYLKEKGVKTRGIGVMLHDLQVGERMTFNSYEIRKETAMKYRIFRA